MSRWIRFFFSILIGIGLGLAYGWILNPPDDQSSTPETLRIDYKTDFVLMVAESYQSNSDIQLASHRLSLISITQPYQQIEEALNFANKVGYNEKDISSIQILLNAFEAQIPLDEGNSP